MLGLGSSWSRRGSLTLLVLALFLAGGLTSDVTRAFAVNSTSTASPSAPAGQVVLKLGWTEEPDNLNVFIGFANTDYEVWALNYSYLFGAGDRNQPTLDLASQFPTVENGGISADGKVWTIHIRSGVRFDDGTPLTAADVAFTYNYIIKNKLANLLEYTQGIDTVTAPDPTTVRFVCAHPMALGYMENSSVPILPKHIWEHVSPEAAVTSYGDKPPIIGSGPFETVGYVKGSYVEMVRNPYYYGKRPTIDTIYFETYQNADTMVNDLEKGRIDGACGVPVAEFKQLESSKGVAAIAYPFYAWDVLEINCYDKPSSLGNPVLRDWRFRQALNYAIDKQRLCALAYSGLATPATTMIPPNTWTNPDYHWQPPASAAYTFDLAKASQMLTAAGYPLKNGVRLNEQGKSIVLRLETPTNEPTEQIEAKLIAGWLQQLGLTIKLSVIDSGALESDMYNGHGTTWQPNYDLVVWSWTGWFDPGQTLSILTSSQIGSMNDPYWSDSQYDHLAVAQESAVDPQQRVKIIWQMQQVIYRQTPWIPLTYPDTLEAYDTTRWTGWTREFNGTGGAWELEGNNSSYLNLRPAAAATTTRGSSSTTLAAVVVIAIVAAVAVYTVVRRRRRRIEDEA
jgi:peptide/nickel transport system substrate-binding protein